MDRFALTETGEASLVLGVNISRTYGEGTLTTTQKKYVQKITGRWTATPLTRQGTGLNCPRNSRKRSYLELRASKSTRLSWDRHFTLHRSPVKHSCYAVYQLTRASSKPSMIHITGTKHLIRYLERLPGSSHHLQEGTVRHARLHRRFVRSKPGQQEVDHRLYLISSVGRPSASKQKRRH